MTTGDKVLALLGAKALCCSVLVLAATGALGGLGSWLLDGPGKWWLALGIIAAIGGLLLSRRSGRPPGGEHATEAPSRFVQSAVHRRSTRR